MSNATVAVVANKYARMRLAPPAEDPLNADRLALATVRIFQFLAMFFRSRIADWLRPVTLRPLVLRRRKRCHAFGPNRDGALRTADRSWSAPASDRKPFATALLALMR